MGEVGEGSSGNANGMVGSDEDLDDFDIVFSDGELEEDHQEAGGSLGQDINAVDHDKQRKGQQQTTRRVKRKPKINDWVVKAFATSSSPRKQ